MAKVQARVRPIWGFALLLWAGATSVVAVSLTARHAIGLPTPERSDPNLASAVASIPEPEAKWTLVHVLYARCKCSQQLVDHLTTSDRPDDARERVLLVGDDGAIGARLRAAGFEVLDTTADDLRDRYHVEAAPMLLIAGPAGDVLYAGGYSPQKQSPDVRDLQILQSLRQGREATPLPTLGCPVSKELTKLLNPLSLP